MASVGASTHLQPSRASESGAAPHASQAAGYRVLDYVDGERLWSPNEAQAAHRTPPSLQTVRSALTDRFGTPDGDWSPVDYGREYAHVRLPQGSRGPWQSIISVLTESGGPLPPPPMHLLSPAQSAGLDDDAANVLRAGLASRAPSSSSPETTFGESLAQDIGLTGEADDDTELLYHEYLRLRRVRESQVVSVKRTLLDSNLLLSSQEEIYDQHMHQSELTKESLYSHLYGSASGPITMMPVTTSVSTARGEDSTVYWEPMADHHRLVGKDQREVKRWSRAGCAYLLSPMAHRLTLNQFAESLAYKCKPTGRADQVIREHKEAAIEAALALQVHGEAATHSEKSLHLLKALTEHLLVAIKPSPAQARERWDNLSVHDRDTGEPFTCVGELMAIVRQSYAALREGEVPMYRAVEKACTLLSELYPRLALTDAPTDSLPPVGEQVWNHVREDPERMTLDACEAKARTYEEEHRTYLADKRGKPLKEAVAKGGAGRKPQVTINALTAAAAMQQVAAGSYASGSGGGQSSSPPHNADGKCQHCGMRHPSEGCWSYHPDKVPKNLPDWQPNNLTRYELFAKRRRALGMPPPAPFKGANQAADRRQQRGGKGKQKAKVVAAVTDHALDPHLALIMERLEQMGRQVAEVAQRQDHQDQYMAPVVETTPSTRAPTTDRTPVDSGVRATVNPLVGFSPDAQKTAEAEREGRAYKPATRPTPGQEGTLRTHAVPTPTQHAAKAMRFLTKVSAHHAGASQTQLLAELFATQSQLVLVQKRVADLSASIPSLSELTAALGDLQHISTTTLPEAFSNVERLIWKVEKGPMSAQAQNAAIGGDLKSTDQSPLASTPMHATQAPPVAPPALPADDGADPLHMLAVAPHLRDRKPSVVFVSNKEHTKGIGLQLTPIQRVMPVRMMVDTGAEVMAITARYVELYGLSTAPYHRSLSVFGGGDSGTCRQIRAMPFVFFPGDPVNEFTVEIDCVVMADNPAYDVLCGMPLLSHLQVMGYYDPYTQGLVVRPDLSQRAPEQVAAMGPGRVLHVPCYTKGSAHAVLVHVLTGPPADVQDAPGLALFALGYLPEPPQSHFQHSDGQRSRGYSTADPSTEPPYPARLPAVAVSPASEHPAEGSVPWHRPLPVPPGVEWPPAQAQAPWADVIRQVTAAATASGSLPRYPTNRSFRGEPSCHITPVETPPAAWIKSLRLTKVPAAGAGIPVPTTLHCGPHPCMEPAESASTQAVESCWAVACQLSAYPVFHAALASTMADAGTDTASDRPFQFLQNTLAAVIYFCTTSRCQTPHVREAVNMYRISRLRALLPAHWLARGFEDHFNPGLALPTNGQPIPPHAALLTAYTEMPEPREGSQPCDSMGVTDPLTGYMTPGAISLLTLLRVYPYARDAYVELGGVWPDGTERPLGAFAPSSNEVASLICFDRFWRHTLRCFARYLLARISGRPLLHACPPMPAPRPPVPRAPPPATPPPVPPSGEVDEALGSATGHSRLDGGEGETSAGSPEGRASQCL